jgi:hypothetical protein
MTNNKFILSAIEFKASVKRNLLAMGLEEIFHIEQKYIMETYDRWLSKQLPDDYRTYVAMLMTLPDHIQFVDTDQLLFKIARKLGHDLVLQLAESFYYEDNMTVIGEKLITEPLADRRLIKDQEVIYFLDIVDTIYDRTNMDYFNGDSSEYTSSTLDLVRNAFRNDNYMNIFGRD